MACRTGELRDEEKNSKAAAAAMSDALLLATMCIIGLPVDVHAKDGSIYSGIFHTASVDNDYAIVLKKARMMKKGNQETNVVIGSLIETLVIPSEEFVQVVAKDILHLANGITGFGGGKDMEMNVGHEECSERVEKVIKPNLSGGNKKHKSQTRFSAKVETDIPHSSMAKNGVILGSSLEEHNERLDKIHEASNVSVGGRPVEDGPQEMKNDIRNIHELQDERNTHEIQSSNPSASTMTISEKTNMQELPNGKSSSSTAHEDQSQKGPTSDGIRCTVPSSQKIYIDPISPVDISESRLNASSAAFIPAVPPKNSNVIRTVKASKLNPGAKIFSPSMLRHRSVAPSAVSNGAGLPYMADVYAVAPTTAAQQEVDISSFTHSSMPIKFVSYNNVAIGNGNSDASCAQPIIGQMVNRTQPLRYAGQYHNFQTGPGNVNPNPQNVMLGRAGSLVCVHPISSDIVQSGAGLSQATSRSLLTPHQVHLPKHQGNASAQALQLCMTPPIIANGPHQFVMPSSIPIPQPLFPVLRPVMVPRSNGFLSPKYT